jgi:hypothetical protein
MERAKRTKKNNPSVVFLREGSGKWRVEGVLEESKLRLGNKQRSKVKRNLGCVTKRMGRNMRV